MKFFKMIMAGASVGLIIGGFIGYLETLPHIWAIAALVLLSFTAIIHIDWKRKR